MKDLLSSLHHLKMLVEGTKTKPPGTTALDVFAEPKKNGRLVNTGTKSKLERLT